MVKVWAGAIGEQNAKAASSNLKDNRKESLVMVTGFMICGESDVALL